MVNGRVHSPEDQLEADRDELAALELEIERRDRADARVVNEPEWDRGLRRLRERAARLRADIGGAA